MNNPDTIESLQALSPDELRVRVAELEECISEAIDELVNTKSPASAIHTLKQALDVAKGAE